MEKKVIKCSECKHCKGHRPYGSTREWFSCEHPDKEYIRKYYKEHKIKKMEGLIGFGKAFSTTVPVKTSPRWCPQNKE